MKKPIPLTSSSSAIPHDPEYESFRASLHRQLVKVAETHAHPHTRALFRWMADGRKGPHPTLKHQPELTPISTPTPELAPAPIKKAPEPRRAPPSRPTYNRPSALTK